MYIHCKYTYSLYIFRHMQNYAYIYICRCLYCLYIYGYIMITHDIHSYIHLYIYDIYIYMIYIYDIYIYMNDICRYVCRICLRGEAELRGGEALRPELEASTELIQALSRAREEREDCLNGWDSIAPYSPNWSSSLGNFDEENWFLSSTFNFRTFSKTNSMVN